MHYKPTENKQRCVEGMAGAAAHVGMGLVYHGKGQYAECLASLEKGHSPGSPGICSTLKERGELTYYLMMLPGLLSLSGIKR